MPTSFVSSAMWAQSDHPFKFKRFPPELPFGCQHFVSVCHPMANGRPQQNRAKRLKDKTASLIEGWLRDQQKHHSWGSMRCCHSISHWAWIVPVNVVVNDVRSWQAIGAWPNGCLIALYNGCCRLSGGPPVMSNMRQATPTGCYSFVYQLKATESHRGCNKRFISICTPCSEWREEALQGEKRTVLVRWLHGLILL